MSCWICSLPLNLLKCGIAGMAQCQQAGSLRTATSRYSSCEWLENRDCEVPRTGISEQHLMLNLEITDHNPGSKHLRLGRLHREARYHTGSHRSNAMVSTINQNNDEAGITTEYGLLAVPWCCKAPEEAQAPTFP